MAGLDGAHRRWNSRLASRLGDSTGADDQSRVCNLRGGVLGATARPGINERTDLVRQRSGMARVWTRGLRRIYSCVDRSNDVGWVALDVVRRACAGVCRRSIVCLVLQNEPPYLARSHVVPLDDCIW